MSLILNTPLPIQNRPLRQDYEYKVLMGFLAFMAILVTLGLLFIDITASYLKQSTSLNNPPKPPRTIMAA